MGKTMNCPFCNYNTTLKVVYCYRGYKKIRNNDVSHLIKDGTIYRNEKPMYKKYDFDGERIRANLYNKYCPNCERYFHTIGKMAVIDIDKVVIIYTIAKEIYRFDFDFSNNSQAKYTYKHNYICIDKDIILTENQRLKILKGIKNSKISLWNKEYSNPDTDIYSWIVKLEYHNKLSKCYYGYNKISESWDTFIMGFKDIIYKYDKCFIDKLV